VPDYGGGFLETSYLLGTQVQHLGEEGRLREVFDWLGVAWRVSDQCRATPSWFVTFPATYITYSACQGAWRGCRNADVPGELSAPTVDRLLKEDGHAAMRKNLIDDRAYALDVLRQDSGPFARVKPPVWDEVYGSPAGVGFRAWDEVGMLHAFAVRISLADRPWHEAAPRLAELKSYLDRRVFDRDLMLLSGDAMQSRRDHEAAQLQAFGLFLAAKAYRHDRGAYPESLDQLAQYLHRTLPVSPFNGQAYGYARQGQGFVVTVPGDPDEVRRTHSLIWKCEK
jgi:hypothetical protein